MSKMNMTYSEAIIFCRYSHWILYQNRPMTVYRVSSDYCHNTPLSWYLYHGLSMELNNMHKLVQVYDEMEITFRHC